MNRFEGKVALITGASRGIGLAVAERLVAEGGSVVITARKQEALDAAVTSLGSNAVGVAGRSDDTEHRAAVYALIAERFGRLDHLVNNAGINPAYGPLAEVGVDVMRKTLEVNVIATLEWAREAISSGLLGEGGSIVNIASIAGIAAAPGIGFYGVSKGALITLTLQQGAEFAPGIRVNAGSRRPSSRRISRKPSTKVTRPRRRRSTRSSDSASRPTSPGPSPSCSRTTRLGSPARRS